MHALEAWQQQLKQSDDNEIDKIYLLSVACI